MEDVAFRPRIRSEADSRATHDTPISQLGVQKLRCRHRTHLQRQPGRSERLRARDLFAIHRPEEQDFCAIRPLELRDVRAGEIDTNVPPLLFDHHGHRVEHGHERYIELGGQGTAHLPLQQSAYGNEQ